jgi:hypothetical protein
VKNSGELDQADRRPIYGVPAATQGKIQLLQGEAIRSVSVLLLPGRRGGERWRPGGAGAGGARDGERQEPGQGVVGAAQGDVRVPPGAGPDAARHGGPPRRRVPAAR